MSGERKGKGEATQRAVIKQSFSLVSNLIRVGSCPGRSKKK